MLRGLVILLAALLASAAPARAETIKLIVAFAAGGPADMLARTVAQNLQGIVGADIIVDNRGGAGGALANEATARSPADGRTLLVGSLGSHVISAALRPQLSYDPLKSFEPLVLIGSVPSVLVIRPQLPAASLADLIAWAKQGNKLSYASAGSGTTMNISGEMLNVAAGIKATHVPYRGAGPAINDLLGGHVDFLCADFPVLLPLIQAKSVRALAMLGNERSPLLPDVPTTAELGYPDFVQENWYGVFAPAGLPPEVKTKLEQAILEALRAPTAVERLAAGGLHGTLDGKAFRARLEADIAYWGPQIKKLGISAE